MRTLLLADMVLTMDDQGRIHHDAGVLVEDNRIIAIAPRGAFEGAVAERVPLSRRLLMPGLINAHTHTPMTLFRGLAEGFSLLTLEGWFHGIRLWELSMTPDMIPPAVAVSCAEMIRTGTTCFADQYFFMDRIAPVVRASGMRAALAYGIVEVGDERAHDWALRAAEAFLESLRHDARLTGWVGPHALFVDNPLPTIQAELALADAYSAGLHIHLSTSGEEDAYCLQHYGVTAVQQMKRIGALDRRMIAAHCLTIPEEDLATLAAAPFAAVIAPSACMRAGRPAAPLKRMLAEGVRVALGTDNVAANNSYDLFKEMQILGKLMAYREGEPNPIPAKTLVEMVTTRAADALGLAEQVGSLEAGKRADLIALDLDAPGFAPRGAQDIYTALVYAVSGLAVQDVMCEGRWLMRDGRLLTVDYRAACDALEVAFAELQTRRARLKS
ncbi:MAG: S-adenosylhomocysteine deaminase [Chloroflexi bacterium]|uniref:S-adenosylhomocysteine deaminase n=1 Tax=Candidatus Thermofonsia Clade 3 bacterium TaxID=2364212 RepID=A0A2M8QDL1_9CHLR|nr:MAG: S-adenosylhomocysteine deaminase [Candidatus Thermofonsia Clade 3 bacterium]RMG65546.1 MAG: S-adenosylhomocysteine deaminase [Chloroflexota bacterium]